MLYVVSFIVNGFQSLRVMQYVQSSHNVHDLSTLAVFMLYKL